MTDNMQILLNKLNKHDTSHGWHFIASILTGGLWVVMWILFTISNAIERGKIERKIQKLLAQNKAMESPVRDIIHGGAK